MSRIKITNQPKLDMVSQSLWQSFSSAVANTKEVRSLIRNISREATEELTPFSVTVELEDSDYEFYHLCVDWVQAEIASSPIRTLTPESMCRVDIAGSRRIPRTKLYFQVVHAEDRASEGDKQRVELQGYYALNEEDL